MTDEFVTEAGRAFEDHGAFERASTDGEAFAVTTTPFDAVVRLSAAGSSVQYRVTVRVPTLDAVVRDEEVAPVVRSGWFETFERRIEDAGGATRVDPDPPTATLDDDAGEVVVETGFETGNTAQGVSDAKALVDYVEGTYVQGIIPGYDYREPASTLLGRAQDRAGTGR